MKTFIIWDEWRGYDDEDMMQYDNKDTMQYNNEDTTNRYNNEDTKSMGICSLSYLLLKKWGEKII